jgi:hypothetical protein
MGTKIQAVKQLWVPKSGAAADSPIHEVRNTYVLPDQTVEIGVDIELSDIEVNELVERGFAIVVGSDENPVQTVAAPPKIQVTKAA